jgi:hypothetical protein
MKKKFRTFTKSRKFVQELGLKTQKDWEQYCKSGNKPDDIPASPEKVYKNEWQRYGDWLGTGRIGYKNRDYREYVQAKKFVQKLNLKGQSDWNNYSKSNKKPKNIPTNPRRKYIKEWTSWGDFLGTGNIANNDKTFRSYEDARKFIRSLGFKGTKDWEDYCKSGNKPDDIPSQPWTVYKKWDGGKK